jgi:hypothetical protein
MHNHGLALSAAGEYVAGATWTAEGILANPPTVPSSTASAWPNLPHRRCLFCCAAQIVRRSRSARGKKGASMSLIEDREAQQLYDEITRRAEPAFHA